MLSAAKHLRLLFPNFRIAGKSLGTMRIRERLGCYVDFPSAGCSTPPRPVPKSEGPGATSTKTKFLVRSGPPGFDIERLFISPRRQPRKLIGTLDPIGFEDQLNRFDISRHIAVAIGSRPPGAIAGWLVRTDGNDVVRGRLRRDGGGKCGLRHCGGGTQ